MAKIRTVRQQLRRLAFGTLLPVVLFAAVGATLLAVRERDLLESGVRERTRAVTTAIDAEINSSAATLQALSAAPSLRDDDLPASHEVLTRALASQPDWLGLHLALPSGQLIADAQVPLGSTRENVQEPASFERVLQNPDPVVGDLLRDARTGQFAFPVRVAVRRDGTVRYVLTALVKPQSLYRILQAQGLPSDWIGVLVDRNGRWVSRTHGGEDRIGEPASRGLQQQIFDAPSGWRLGETREGIAVYTAHDTSSASGWTFAIGVPAALVEEAARHTVIVTLLGTLAAATLAWILATLLGRRFAASISDLAQAARSLTRGAPLEVPPSSPIREVMQLSEALTEAGRAVAVRQEIQRQLTAVTRNATVGLVMTDPDRRLTYMNPAAERMLGRSLHMVRGLSLHEVLHHVGAVELHSPGACRLLHACAASESVTGEDVVLKQSGELLAVAFAASPIPGGVGSVVELRDITQQKASERERAELLAREQRARLEAERSNKAKDEFLAMLGHELRNPLAAISNASHVLDRTGGNAAEQAKAIMRRQAQHLARLVDDLIDAGRVTTGKIVLVQQPVALDAVVQRALATPGLAGRSESHELIVGCEPATVFGDETRLEQIVSNLLTNAFRYTPNGGTVTVTLAAEDDQAVLTVQDTGFGIEPAMLPRIFELFFQGERGIERAQGGLGIGLTLVKRLVEQHGGTVEAQSDGQNRGSRFTVRLPLLKQAAHAVAAAPPKAAAAPQRILIVEDNADVRSMLATVLQMAGHEVLEAPDGPSAIETAARTLPDTVILDIGLPGLSGYEVAERIRTMAPLAHTRLIALSGYGQDQDRAQAAQAGFNAHLVKPVAPDLLLATLA